MDQEIPWLKALRERIEKTLKSPPDAIQIHAETPKFDEIISREKEMDQWVKKDSIHD